MKSILCILAAAALFFLSGKACSAQVDSNAVKNADDFLAAVKIAEIPEGIQALFSLLGAMIMFELLRL